MVTYLEAKEKVGIKAQLSSSTMPHKLKGIPCLIIMGPRRLHAKIIRDRGSMIRRIGSMLTV